MRRGLITNHNSEKIIFVCVGFINTVFGLIIHYLLYIFLNTLIDYKLISLLANFFAILFNFFTYNFIVYKAFDRLFIRFGRFFFANFINILLSLVLFIIFHGFIGLSYFIVIPITLIFTVIYSYYVNKYLIFKKY
jgi:putative flippase GtrA